MRARIGRTAVVLVTALVTAVMVAALAGCVGMPVDGPVVETRSGGDVAGDTGVFVDPRPPQPGETGLEIVRGFLSAMQATPVQTRTARLFLTADASASWNPGRETITYPEFPEPRATRGGVTIRLRGADHLDARGAWQGPLPRGDRRVTFPLVLEDDQWRIDAAPDALIVPDQWFQARYRQLSLYFFDPTATVLEPEPVYVPRGEQLATSLTQALLMGPGRGLRRVAQSFVPSGLKVPVGVSVSGDGVADVLLTGDAPQLSPKTVELMMAQFAWTLRQDPAIRSIRVSIGDVPVPLPGGVGSYRVDGGTEYDPAGAQSSPLIYGLRNGRLVSGTAAALQGVGGPLGDGGIRLRSVGVALSGSRAAGVTVDGTAAVTGAVGDTVTSSARTVLVGSDLLKPAWDFANRIWLLDRTARGARISWVQGEDAHVLRVPGVSGQRVRAFLVSRDGTRLVAVVVHRRRTGGAREVVLTSRIEHSASGRVVGATPAERLLVGQDTQLPVQAVTWRTSASVAVLNPFTPTLVEVTAASVDGSSPNPDSTSTAVEGRVRGLVGSPVLDEPLYAVTRRSLVDVTSVEQRTVPLQPGTTAVTYVG
jgi:hypothetical protein